MHGGSYYAGVLHQSQIKQATKLVNEAKQYVREAEAAYQRAQAYAPGSQLAKDTMTQWKKAKAAVTRANTNLKALKNATTYSGGKQYLANVRSAHDSAYQAASTAQTLAGRAARSKTAQQNGGKSVTGNGETGGNKNQDSDYTKSPEVASPVNESTACGQQSEINVSGDDILKDVLVVGSIAAIAASIVVAGPVLSAVLLGAGVSSLIGGFLNEAQGGSFFAGWVGGAVSGALAGAGLGVGAEILTEIFGATAASATEVLTAFGQSALAAVTGGGAGGFLGSLFAQGLDGQELDVGEAVKDGLVSAVIAGAASPFGVISPLMAEGAQAAGSVVSTAVEFVFDTFTSLISEAN